MSDFVSFSLNQVSWSIGTLKNIKFQAPNFRVSGVRCQVSAKRNIETATCWSEAEIPSEAKRQRGTLKYETHNFGSAFGG
jgi:hypothetical protein